MRPISLNYHWSKYLKNWLVMPLIWMGSVWLGCLVTGIEFTWRPFVLAMIVSFINNVIEAVVDDRPVNGPYRWKDRT